MNRLGFKTEVFEGDVRLGELDYFPVTAFQNFRFPNNEIRIHHRTYRSERCPPLSILQSISAFNVRCKLDSSLSVEQPLLINLHASCFHEMKTAVAVVGDEELHLVAMPSKRKKFPCFWCYAVPVGLYDACMGMLNLRCLSIVFDLDETLIVANTMKSFEDRIEALRCWLLRESDPLRVQGMSGELKRYLEDRLLLKQFIEMDSVVDSNGKLYQVQMEEVPSLSEQKVLRPVVRLQDRNIVLTRINPEIRDTSVLVKLRPAWEDLRCYLTAKGRKRFEVYVCTMAERDYALEMWRLLDPGAHLIGSKQVFDRVICVKSGSRKSLLNVFHDGMCHPKMAMVIDDRSKVWEDKDQPRVHVVPAFSPYYAPQAETANAVPVLCVARNVACNVRGCFFKEFDENFIQRIAEIFFEDEVVNLPHPPDVSSYLMSEEAPNGNGNAYVPVSEGMGGTEFERRLNQPDDKVSADLVSRPMANSADFRHENSQPTAGMIPNVTGHRSSRPIIPSQKDAISPNHASSNGRDLQNEVGKLNFIPSLSIRMLLEIGRRLSKKVEFRSVVSTSKDLQFSVEVLYTDEKIGFGMGRTRRDAQQLAAENALRSLAEKYVTNMEPLCKAVNRELDDLSLEHENGFLWDEVNPESSELQTEDGLQRESASEASDAETRPLKSNPVNQQNEKRSFPRTPQPVSSKRLKE
ncbi:unnamed protein product [Trifolium pratense]|uniref:Uncharacterized protein n=1 Tax=Trifolium pratense TaxID=57577 RepID=A0ACB0LGH9_TRIPR|nr:unnamed protein product [Trifolium pratense]